VTQIENESLTFATNFKADEATDAQLAYYGDWYADFVLTFQSDATMNANGGADGYLSGQYDAWSANWVNVPAEDVTLKAGQGLKIMEYAAELLNQSGLKVTYNDVYSFVKDFDCGVFLEDAYILEHAGEKITLELRIYNPENEAESYVIGQTYTYTIPEITDAVAQNVQTGKIYDDAAVAAMDAEAGQTVILLKDTATAHLLVPEEVVFDLNGYTLETTYTSVFGDMIDSSEANTGVLKVAKSHFLIQTDNKQLTVKTDKGYQFVEIIHFKTAWLGNKFVFEVKFEEAAHELMKNGVAVTGVNIQVNVTWTSTLVDEDGTAYENADSRTFKYGDTLVTGFINSYNSETGKYGMMFELTLTNPENFANLKCTAQVVSDSKVVFGANERAYGETGIEQTKP